MGNYSNLLKLKPYVKNCKLWLIGGIIGMAICSVIYVPVPYLTGYIIDKILLKHGSCIDLYKFIAILALLYISRYVISIFSKKLFIKIENFVVNEIRMSMMDKIIDLPMSFLSKNEKGYVLSRISECSNIGRLFSPTFISTFLSVFDLIFAIIMMVALNYKLTIVVLILVPIYYFTVKSSSKHLTESTKVMLETSAVLSGETYEVLNGIEEIKILNGKETQLIKFKNKLEAMVKSGIKQSKQILFFMENITLVNNLATLIILLFSGVLILKGELTIGIYTAFATYMSKVFGSTMSFANLGMTLKPVCVSIERIQEFLDLADENEARSENIEEAIETINIENLSFKYEVNGQNIINNLNFIINKGDKLFLKGENGTGVSGGQTQIIAFLRAIVTKKDIIILDEATTNLDTETREVILEILRKKNIANIIIVISHQEEGIEFTNKTLSLKKIR
jgi:ATP-binding cassette subfamily B protein